MRYESDSFFDQATAPGDSNACGNRSADQATPFTAAAQQVLKDLQIATPRIAGFFAATKTQVADAANSAIYAFAQCVETVTESGCLDCLTAGYNNIKSCLPNVDGRAFDAGCYMRLAVI